MRRGFVFPALLAAIAIADAANAQGALNEQRARLNWMLHCQGCHLPDATGTPGGAPNMAGEVARFLKVDGGREYLTRVPGVANAGLPDDQLTELLNWLLVEFDESHLPDDFRPFTVEEIALGRKQPYVSEAAAVRAALREKISSEKRVQKNERGAGE